MPEHHWLLGHLYRLIEPASKIPLFFSFVFLVWCLSIGLVFGKRGWGGLPVMNTPVIANTPRCFVFLAH